MCEIIAEAYPLALKRATLEAFEGQYDEQELGQQVDRARIVRKALGLVVALQNG